MYDPTIDYYFHESEYDQSIKKVLNHGQFIMGPEVKELEKQLTDYCHVKHCIAVSNGTDALMIALMALNIKPDDEVITVPFTWISTAEIICILNAKPVFADIDEKTYNLDPTKLEEKITEKTKAIIPVSLYGLMANMEEICKIAEKYNIPVIEDGAQSFGAMIGNIKSCSCSWEMNKISCTSFFPSKPLGCYGDGGACFTSDDELALKLRAIRTHGGTERFKHKYVGTNARLNTLQAAILLVKVKYLDEALEKRRRNAKIYERELDKIDEIEIPYIPENYRSVYGQYTIKLRDQKMRDALMAYLKEKNVQTSIFYPIAIHTQEAFKEFNYREGDFPVSEEICTRVLSIPCYPELEEKDIFYVAKEIGNFFIN